MLPYGLESASHLSTHGEISRRKVDCAGYLMDAPKFLLQHVTTTVGARPRYVEAVTALQLTHSQQHPVCILMVRFAHNFISASCNSFLANIAHLFHSNHIARQHSIHSTSPNTQHHPTVCSDHVSRRNSIDSTTMDPFWSPPRYLPTRHRLITWANFEQHIRPTAILPTGTSASHTLSAQLTPYRASSGT